MVAHGCMTWRQASACGVFSQSRRARGKTLQSLSVRHCDRHRLMLMEPTSITRWRHSRRHCRMVGQRLSSLSICVPTAPRYAAARQHISQSMRRRITSPWLPVISTRLRHTIRSRRASMLYRLSIAPVIWLTICAPPTGVCWHTLKQRAGWTSVMSWAGQAYRQYLRRTSLVLNSPSCAATICSHRKRWQTGQRLMKSFVPRQPTWLPTITRYSPSSRSSSSGRT